MVKKILAFILIFVISSLLSLPTSPLVWAQSKDSSFNSQLTTLAETSNWQQTGRAVEVEKLCKNFARRYPQRVQYKNYGISPEGRKLWYLIIQDEKPKPDAPVIWLQAGIHAGEIDGKDAVFLLLKNVLTKKITQDPFRNLQTIFIPIVNVDGHERFGRWNRPNQIGPEEMGWRTTAQNYNLNRDFAKVEATEIQDLTRLWNKYTPLVSLDLHVTDGAKFQPEVGIIVLPNSSFGATTLHSIGQVFEESMMAKMKDRGRSALPFYPSFEKSNDPKSGFVKNVMPPRYANGYWFVRNRLGVLVESHSWKDYATRVRVHYDTVLSALEVVQKNGPQWLSEVKKIDQVNLSNKTIELDYKKTDTPETINFAGYHYLIEKSKISGADVIRYFDDQPEVWTVPYYSQSVAVKTVQAPDSGYLIPESEMKWLKNKLDIHAIQYRLWDKPKPELVNVFRASKTVFSTKPFEGRQTLQVEGAWRSEKIQLPEKLYFVPVHQPSGKIAVFLLEPISADSFLSWGFFNRFFEQKEYMEDYVTEEVAKEMLANNIEIRKEFEEKLKDKTFASDPDKRYRFFYEKHASWDQHFNRYPIFRF